MRALPALPVLWLLGGCAGMATPSGPPLTPPEADGIARAAGEATRPGLPTRIDFNFRVREADLRFEGRGVARIEPSYRVRLDLFSPSGETLFQAALVEGHLRIPPWAPRELAPPPALLWAALGIFRPDPDLSLIGGRKGGAETTSLRYGGPEEMELRFWVEGERLTRAELHREGRLMEEVDLRVDRGSGRVEQTVYRNHPLFLELTFILQSVQHVESFPAEIWYPGR